MGLAPGDSLWGTILAVTAESATRSDKVLAGRRGRICLNQQWVLSS